MEFSVFDTETTGFAPDKGARILEIAAVRISADGTELGSFATLVDPGPQAGVGATHIHGITREMLAGAPDPASALAAFAEFVQGSTLVAHNAPFDVKFLKSEFELAGIGWPNPVVLDTLGAARFLVPGLASYKLADLAAHLGGRVDGTAHAALADARAAAGVHASLLARTVDHSWPTPPAWPSLTVSMPVKQRAAA